MFFMLSHTYGSRLIAPLSIAAIVLPAQILALLNYSQFAQKHLLLPGARSLGYSHSKELTLPELAYFYETVLWDVFVLLPIATVVLSCIFRKSKLFLVWLALASILITLISFTNLLTVANTGNLMVGELLIEAIKWGSANPEIISDYISYSAMAKFMLFATAPVAIAVYLARVRDSGSLGLPVKGLAIVSGASLLLSLSMIGAGRTSAAHGSIIIQNYSALQIRTLFGLHTDYNSEMFPFALADTIAEFRDWEGRVASGINDSGSPELTALPYDEVEPTAKNVIFVILETLPERVVASKLAAGGMPNLQRISEKSFVSRNHYSTYPYSSDALFSIFSSMYPNFLRRRLSTTGRRFSGLGLFNILQNGDFMTATYAPNISKIDPDTAMFHMLGTNQQFFSETLDSESIHASKYNKSQLMQSFDAGSGRLAPKSVIERTLKDDVVFIKMLEDIREAVTQDRRFATVFLPQTGHGPWKPWKAAEPLWKSGENLSGIYDVWLGEIVATLEQLGVLETTLIVITSDHGLRTKSEYPGLSAGGLDKHTFAVPLFIFAPNVLHEIFEVNGPTSHIDIMPTVLALLGISDQTMCKLGRPIWSPQLSIRPVFFLAQGYLGASGLSYDGHFYSRNFLTGVEFRNSSFDLGSSSMVSADSRTESKRFRQALSYQQGFQMALRDKILAGQNCYFIE